MADNKLIHFSAVPIMDRVRFSELSGVNLGILDGWIDRGYIPSRKIGKHRLVDIASLTQECLEGLHHV